LSITHLKGKIRRQPDVVAKSHGGTPGAGSQGLTSKSGEKAKYEKGGGVRRKKGLVWGKTMQGGPKKNAKIPKRQHF